MEQLLAHLFDDFGEHGSTLGHAFAILVDEAALGMRQRVPAFENLFQELVRVTNLAILVEALCRKKQYSLAAR